MSEIMQPTLKSASASGWTAGLGNMLRKENGIWWGTRKWLVQTIIWTIIVTGLVTTMLYLQMVFMDEGTKARRHKGTE